LEILPDRALRELGDDDSAPWVVVRGNDDITIDLMTEACGVRHGDAAGGIETEEIEGGRLPFAGAQLMLKMKQTPAKRTLLIETSFSSSSGILEMPHLTITPSRRSILKHVANPKPQSPPPFASAWPTA